MSARKFTGNFTQQEPLSETAIEAAAAVLRSGRLHRYNLAPGEVGEVALLEEEFAAWQGSRYCIAVASGGQAIQIALRAAGVAPDDRVLTNAFTLAPVPGAIHAVGARPVLVEIDENLRLDFEDLARRAESSGARFLLLSHMRGHLCDMDRLMSRVAQFGLTVIEDCAHTMGATWNNLRSGSFGLAGCFSTQTYKHINSGEGGLLTSDDPDFIARATILSGSYMHYARHGAGPDPEHFARPRYDMANMSARMDALRAAILRPQIRSIEENVARWNRLYTAVASELVSSNRIVLPARPEAEGMVGSSIQFRVPDLGEAGCRRVVAQAGLRGVELKWFGNEEPKGFTSMHRSWRYVDPHQLPQTDGVLATLFDMRLPLTFSEDDCTLIGRIIREEVSEVRL
ncbi:DegT/DnrJ/EryC1/StrS family aminotransferase [Oricola cellulosilytica]|uniref:DegT/DnrJ/EryC1/StrS aminotransferase family protein n=1 Tax=Oricola cellulosilytica TaxID=1429082 RepID=A0A4R0PCZ1_9HYPH|nr:DegT/DnrJ/EryC1/StrS aminotransferase family protein [Oricola cellulosilytica]TCD14179.1 DegT/DnrJ/EryC1/StrS aminotransferase family protein [Oricola cellulosilytica]